MPGMRSAVGSEASARWMQWSRVTKAWLHMERPTSWNRPGIEVRTPSSRRRCATCRQRSSGPMFALHERLNPSTAASTCQSWVVCERCAAAVLSELERSALRSPLRVRIAVGMVAAQQRPAQIFRILDVDYWERKAEQHLERLLVGFVLFMFGMPPLVFWLVMALTLPGGAAR